MGSMNTGAYERQSFLSCNCSLMCSLMRVRVMGLCPGLWPVLGLLLGLCSGQARARPRARVKVSIRVSAGFRSSLGIEVDGHLDLTRCGEQTFTCPRRSAKWSQFSHKEEAVKG